MIPPSGMALAALTVMLWLIWSDTIRTRRVAPILYAIRIALFLIVGGVLLMNRIRHPELFSGTARILVAITAGVSLAGAAYFARKLTRRA